MSMDSNTMLLNAIVKETAAKVIDGLDADAKKAILTEAMAKLLQNMNIGWEVSKIFHEEAMKFAKEYIKHKDVQEKMKQKVIEAAEEVMDGLAKCIANSIENDLKNEYKKWTGEEDCC